MFGAKAERDDMTAIYKWASWAALLTLATPAWPAVAQNAPNSFERGYPAEVALDDEGDKGLLFRRFPGSQRLYTYDLDKPNQSECDLGCDGPRPPVYVACSATPMPDWTIVKRYNGLCQWAYKKHPLYTYFHDVPGDPTGDGEAGVWHLLGYFKQP
jgi:predicted lipoprotein with Yx(FWY)xxD motif